MCYVIEVISRISYRGFWIILFIIVIIWIDFSIIFVFFRRLFLVRIIVIEKFSIIFFCSCCSIKVCVEVIRFIWFILVFLGKEFNWIIGFLGIRLLIMFSIFRVVLICEEMVSNIL